MVRKRLYLTLTNRNQHVGSIIPQPLENLHRIHRRMWGALSTTRNIRFQSNEDQEINRIEFVYINYYTIVILQTKFLRFGIFF